MQHTMLENVNIQTEAVQSFVLSSLRDHNTLLKTTTTTNWPVNIAAMITNISSILLLN